jgi:c(7)-type cytochrome triheme protein
MNYLTLAALAVFVAFLLMLSSNATSVSEASFQAGDSYLRLGGGPSKKSRVQTTRSKGLDYSKFSHNTHAIKEKLACDSCHKFPTANWKDVRKGDAAFPDIAEFPEHGTCINCHRKQFFARQRPAPIICSNCHVNATPRNTTRFLFPSLGEAFLSTTKDRDFVSDFYVAFPHDKHADASCDDCHQTYQPQGNSDAEFVTNPPKDLGERFWLKKGTFKTRPLTHTQCFTCHNKESEVPPLPPNCDACHKPKPAEKRAPDFDKKLLASLGIQDWWTMTAWRNRSSAGAFRHEVHSDLKCTQCHQASTGNAVSLKSCGGADGCHVTATADEGGILNYEVDQRNASASFVCTKCHIGFGKEAVPASHVRAIEASKKFLTIEYLVQVQMKVPDNADYSKFQHTSAYHARLPCALCHRRESNSPAPAMPGGNAHLPCAGCHVKQLNDSSSAICSNCHSNPPAATLKPFPKLRSFRMTFDHSRHVGINCASCHRPSRGGVALSIPVGINAHTTCFQCHKAEAKAGNRDISSCGVCHQVGPYVRTGQMTRAFSVGFSHAQHNRDEGLGCNDCHRVRSGVQKGSVTAPQSLNHHAARSAFSCMSCHDGERAFGGDDFSVCKRCHKGSAWRF